MKILSASFFILVLACKQGNSKKEIDVSVATRFQASTLDTNYDTTLIGDWQANITDSYPESEIKMETTIFWHFNSNKTGTEIYTIKSISTANNSYTSFTINYPFKWETTLSNTDKKIKIVVIKYGLGKLINPPPSKIKKDEPNPSIDLANSLTQEQSNKTLKSEYKKIADLLLIYNNELNSDSALKFSALSPITNCDISLFRASNDKQPENRNEKEPVDRLLSIFMLWKLHRIEILDFEKMNKELGRKIKYYTEKNQKENAIKEVDKMSDYIKNRILLFKGNSKFEEVQRLQKLTYCYYARSLTTYKDVNDIILTTESNKDIIEKIVTYFKKGTVEDNKKILEISSEIVRLDELYDLSNIVIKKNNP